MVSSQPFLFSANHFRCFLSGFFPPYGDVDLVRGLSGLPHVVDELQDVLPLWSPQKVVEGVDEVFLVGLHRFVGRQVFDVLGSVFEHVSVPHFHGFLRPLLLECDMVLPYLLLVLGAEADLVFLAEVTVEVLGPGEALLEVDLVQDLDDLLVLLPLGHIPLAVLEDVGIGVLEVLPLERSCHPSVVALLPSVEHAAEVLADEEGALLSWVGRDAPFQFGKVAEGEEGLDLLLVGVVVDEHGTHEGGITVVVAGYPGIGPVLAHCRRCHVLVLPSHPMVKSALVFPPSSAPVASMTGASRSMVKL